MNILLSVIVSLALIFSGGSLPAVPQEATVTTLRNLSVSTGDKTVALDHEFVLTTAFGMDEAAGRFEIRRGEEVLLPLTGVLNPKSADFSIIDSNHYISVPAAALRASFLKDFDMESFLNIYSDEELQAVGLDRENTSLDELLSVGMNGMVDSGRGIAKMLEALRILDADPALYVEDMRLNARAYAALLAAEERAGRVVVEGERHPSAEYSFTLSAADELRGYDAMLSCGNPELEKAYRLILEAYSGIMNEELTSFEQAAEYFGDGSKYYSMSFASGEGWEYFDTYTSAMGDGDGASSSSEQKFLLKGDVATISLSGEESNEFGTLDYALKGSLTGGVIQPERAELEFKLSFESYATAFELSGSLQLEGRGWSVEGVFESGETAQPFTLASAAAGENARSFSFGLPEKDFSFSFELHSEKTAYRDFFAGKTKKVHNLSANSPAASQLNIDALAMASDAMAFASDKQVIAFSNAFKPLLEGLILNVNMTSAYTGADEGLSLDIAAEDFNGEIPNYTPPEGYTLQEVHAGEDALAAVYANGDRLFLMECYYYPEYENTDSSRYELFPDGSARPVEGPVMNIMFDAEYGYSAMVDFGDEYQYWFQFDNISDEDEMIAIAAGLCQ